MIQVISAAAGVSRAPVLVVAVGPLDHMWGSVGVEIAGPPIRPGAPRSVTTFHPPSDSP